MSNSAYAGAYTNQPEQPERTAYIPQELETLKSELRETNERLLKLRERLNPTLRCAAPSDVSPIRGKNSGPDASPVALMIEECIAMARNSRDTIDEIASRIDC